ncbi:MAG: hypothetical protein M5U26_18075 [Planctomycetota bacterium]|nr:hypothetical protein [Planctomycetota bacterium]
MEVWIWNGLDGFPIRKLDSGSTWITANVLSGDNSLYGYGDKDGNISVGSIFGNNRGLQFRQGRKVVAISFSPDMSRVASCLPGAYIWDLSNGSLVYEFHHGEHGITSVAFAPQGDYIAIGNGDDTVAMYGRIHPEWWWGHFYQVEVWLSLLFMGLLMSTYIGGKRVQGVPMAAKPSVKAKKEPDAKGTRRAPDPPDPKYP